MNKKILRSIIILGIIIFMNIILSTNSKAALSISPSKTSVAPGEQFSVKVSVSENEAGHISLSATNGTISSTNIDLMSQSSVTVTCTAGNSGTITIKASGKVANYETETEETQNASKNITIVVPEEKPTENTPTEKPEEKPVENTKSSNNKLKNLGIRPNDFTTFKPGTTTYYITVPNDVSEVEVYAEKQESSQKISGTGTVKLKEGSNTVRVVCTAEDGTTKTYTMYITREKVEEEANTAEENQTEEPTNNEEQTTEETQENIEQTVEKVLGITNLNITAKTENGETIKTELSPAFMENQDEYQLTVPLNVVDLEITVETQDGTAEVEVMGNKNLAEGENIVTVIVKVGEETKIYQITVNKTAVTGASALSNEVIMQLAAIAAIATVIIVVIIALIIMIIRSKKKTKKQTKPAINTEIVETSNIESNNEEKEEIYNK